MTSHELAVWLMAHGWTVEVLTGRILAEHPERGRRRYTLCEEQGKLVGDVATFWRVERLRRTGPTR